MTTALVIPNIQRGAPMIGILLAIVIVGWLAYRMNGRGRSDRDGAGDRSRQG